LASLLMRKPLISKDALNASIYIRRTTFNLNELLADLPEEMRAAKTQIPDAQCYGQFYVNDFSALKCKVKKPDDTMYAIYLWSCNSKRWLRD
jgi:hypothetical protein